MKIGYKESITLRIASLLGLYFIKHALKFMIYKLIKTIYDKKNYIVL
jgi:hypothetical protein